MSALAQQVYVPIPRTIAKSRGLKMYFVGNPCSKGHLVFRWVTDGRCYLCAKERVNSRYVTHGRVRKPLTLEQLARNAERHREGRKQNPEKYAAYDHAEYSRMKVDPLRAEKERIRQLEKQKRRYWANPELFKEKARQRNATPQGREKNSKWGKEYKRRNPEGVRALNLKWNHLDRAARKQRLPKWLTDEDKEIMRKMYAMAKVLGVHVDHIIPLQGKNVSGLHVPSNLQLMLPSENCSKKNKFEVV